MTESDQYALAARFARETLRFRAVAPHLFISELLRLADDHRRGEIGQRLLQPLFQGTDRLRQIGVVKRDSDPVPEGLDKPQILPM